MQPFYLDVLTGKRVQSPDYAVACTDVPSAKLMSTQQVPVQYLRITGQKGVPVAAPSTSIKFGLKPGTIARGHYSDTAFDVFTDTFTAPADPTLADAFYTATLVIDSTALRALFPVAGDGTSAGTASLIGEILSGTLPSSTFDFTAQNNLIKNNESPAVAVAGPSGYPTPEFVASLHPFTVHTFATDADKLAGAGVNPGDHALITGEGNRLEKFVPTLPTLHVSGSDQDGAYTQRGVFNGRPYYILDGYSDGTPDDGAAFCIFWGYADEWRITNNDGTDARHYFSLEDVASADLVTAWSTDGDDTDIVVTRSDGVSNRNWFVLRNTINLFVLNISSNSATVARVPVSNGGTITSVGWVFADEIPFQAPNDTYISQVAVVDPDDPSTFITETAVTCFPNASGSDSEVLIPAPASVGPRESIAFQLLTD